MENQYVPTKCAQMDGGWRSDEGIVVIVNGARGAASPITWHSHINHLAKKNMADFCAHPNDVGGWLAAMDILTHPSADRGWLNDDSRIITYYYVLSIYSRPPSVVCFESGRSIFISELHVFVVTGAEKESFNLVGDSQGVDYDIFDTH